MIKNDKTITAQSSYIISLVSYTVYNSRPRPIGETFVFVIDNHIDAYFIGTRAGVLYEKFILQKLPTTPRTTRLLRKEKNTCRAAFLLGFIRSHRRA